MSGMRRNQPSKQIKSHSSLSRTFLVKQPLQSWVGCLTSRGKGVLWLAWESRDRGLRKAVCPVESSPPLQAEVPQSSMAPPLRTRFWAYSWREAMSACSFV